MKLDMKLVLTAALVAACCLSAGSARADFFGAGEYQFEIPLVTVGDPGNPADTTGEPNPAGSVPYTYQIGKYEVPEEAIRKANAQSELDGEPLGITLDERGPQKPATRVSWFEAARFVNWLNDQKGAPPAYKFDASGEFQLWYPGEAGYNPSNRFRNSLARYFLPSVDEWYKAAFYDPTTGGYWDYPTGSDEEPIPVEFGTDPGTAVWNQTVGPADVMLAGGESPYGTVAQGGNVYEWQEGPVSGVLSEIPNPDVRAYRSGRWGLAASAAGLSVLSVGDLLASISGAEVGLRIACVPEPTTLAAAITFLLTLACRCTRK